MFVYPCKRRASVLRPNRQLKHLQYVSEIAKIDPATVAVRNSNYAVILCLNFDMPEQQSGPKFVAIDEHVAMSFIGVETDGHGIGNYLTTKCFEYKLLHSKVHPIPRLAAILAQKIRREMKHNFRTPYSVIVLIAGHDDKGAHIFEVSPFGVISTFNALSIGHHSKSARIYLKSKMALQGKYIDTSKKEIIQHGIRAVLATLTDEEECDSKVWNITIGIVGADQPFKIFSDAESSLYIEQVRIKQMRVSRYPEPAEIVNV